MDAQVVDTNLAKGSQTYVQIHIKMVKVKTVIPSQSTLWRFRVTEGQNSDVNPLDQTQGDMEPRSGIQGQRHIAGDMGSQGRSHLSISKSGFESLPWCSRSLIEFHGWGPGSHVWSECRHIG